ncbi:MAG: extracellular solute-binding protein [Christensenellales bacterium]
MKRLLACILVLVLIASCSMTLAEGAFEPFEEPFKLKVVMRYNESERPGLTPEKTIWNDWLKEYLNIELEWLWITTDGGWNEKLNASLASGDIPDVLNLNSSQYREFLDNGYLRPIDDAWNKYASDALKSMYEKVHNDPLRDATYKNQLYAIPRAEDNTAVTKLLWIRQDWLDNLGEDIPTCTEELAELMRKFTFNDPDKDGKDNTYGFAMHGDPGNITVGYFGIFEAFGAYPYRWILRDGQIVNGSIQPEMKQALDYLRDLYAEKVLNPEFATLSYDQCVADISNSKVGLLTGQWHLPNHALQNSMRNDSACEWIAVPMVSTETGVPAKTILNEQLSYEFNVVTVTAPKGTEEALVKMMNLFADVCFSTYYPEYVSSNVYWSTDPEERKAQEERFIWYWAPVRIWDPAQNVGLTEGYTRFFASADGELPSFITSDSDIALVTAWRNWWLQPKTERTRDDSVYGDWIWAWAYGMNFGGPESTYALGLKLKDEGYNELDVNYGGSSTAGSKYSSTINAHISTYINRYIMGEVAVESWDQFVSDVLQMGGQEWTDEINAAYWNIHK